MKKLVLLISALLLMVSTFAQDVKFTANAKNIVSEGERFRLTFTVNEQGDGFRPPNLSDFNVLTGPSTSTSQSMQLINGKFSQEVNVTYSYMLTPKKTGKFTIGAAKINVSGKTYESNPITLEVVKGNSSNAPNPSAQSQAQAQPAQSGQIGNNDLFLKLELNKNEAYVGEPIVATLKVYTKVQIRFKDIKSQPVFSGFYSHTLENKDGNTLKSEQYNGEVYEAAVLDQFLIFPQKTGELTIDPAEYEWIYYYKVQRRSFFDNGYREATKITKSNSPKVKVKALPLGKPASYSGAVGSFSISATTDVTKAKTNDPINLKITVSGSGNLKLVDLPEFDFPADFEVYDPQLKNNYTNTTAGSRGSKTWEYLVIPRHAGTFTIPSIELDYFDLGSKTYKTVSTKPIEIAVEKGEGSGTAAGPMVQSFTKEDVKVLGTDIKFIKTNDIKLRSQPSYLAGSTLYWMLHIVPAFLLIAFILFRIKQIKENSNIAKMRNKQAGKVSKKHLKEANKFLQENKEGEFYDSLLKALWGYLSDKLNLPLADLTKDNVNSKLIAVSVSSESITQFMNLVNACEFAKYAPAAVGDSKEETLNKASQIIDALENEIR